MWAFSTLRSQFVALVTASVVSSNLGVIAIVESTRQREMHEERLNAAAERIAAVFRYLSAIPESQRATAVIPLSGNRFSYSTSSNRPISNHDMNETERLIALRLQSREPIDIFGPVTARVTERFLSFTDDAALVLEISQPIAGSGEWLFARFVGPPTPSSTGSILIAAVVCTMLTGAAATWLAERVSRPLSSLAEAAHQVADGCVGVRLNCSGPRDFKQTAEAFNRMSDHVSRTVESHRKLLAAIGHDLRTPLAAIRLSAEFVDDEKLHDRLNCNADELQSITEDILSGGRLPKTLGRHALASIAGRPTIDCRD